VSLLDRMIRRLTAQRTCLEAAAALVADLPGPVLELGLGHGRTYDHLRQILPEREVFVFERQPAALPEATPDAAHLFEGDFLDTLPTALARLPGPAVLAHADIGTRDKAASEARARAIAPLLVPLLAPGAVIVSDQPLDPPGAQPLPLPEGVAPGRIHMWRMPGGA
jgi:hypothetical protein